jgi:hypothetical protein
VTGVQDAPGQSQWWGSHKDVDLMSLLPAKVVNSIEFMRFDWMYT